MKKNELGSFITYIGMFALLMLVSFLVVRPAVGEYVKDAQIPAILLIILSIIGGIVLNALLLEQGHIVGAKAGGYKIISTCILGLTFVKKDGKTKTTFSSFAGLTGETKVVPTDTKANSLTAYISFPLLSFLVELLVGVILIAIGKANSYALYIAATIILSIGGAIFFYNYFPARLDVETDGYRMTILNKPINKEAYNDMLLAQYNLSIGKPSSVSKTYDDVTDFTAQINLVRVYEKLKSNDFSGAIVLLQKTIDSPHYVSSRQRTFANILKLSLVILTTKKEDGATFYKTIDDSHRRYIQELNDSVSVRTLILIQGVLEGEFEETKYGLEKAPRLIEKAPDYAKEVEKTLYQFGLDRIASLHPTWDLKPYSLKKEEVKQ